MLHSRNIRSLRRAAILEVSAIFSSIVLLPCRISHHTFPRLASYLAALSELGQPETHPWGTCGKRGHQSSHAIPTLGDSVPTQVRVCCSTLQIGYLEHLATPSSRSGSSSYPWDLSSGPTYPVGRLLHPWHEPQALASAKNPHLLLALASTYLTLDLPWTTGGTAGTVC